jgi:hypothetical protein
MHMVSDPGDPDQRGCTVSKSVVHSHAIIPYVHPSPRQQ